MPRMHFARYDAAPLSARLLSLVFAVVVLNAAYCLAYRYSVGNPATLAEAFSWGSINLAPWVAVIEVGRHLRDWRTQAALIAAGGLASLLLGAAYNLAAPDLHEVVRRVPGALLSVAALFALSHLRVGGASRNEQDVTSGVQPSAKATGCLWVRAAGNYVELQSGKGRKSLVRSPLASFIESSPDEFIRIHRSFAVAPHAVSTVERNHVRLHDGTRLPIGNAYRTALAADDFVPSSHPG